MRRWSMFLIAAVILAVFGVGGVSRNASDLVWMGMFLVAMFTFAFVWRAQHSEPPSP